LTLRLLHADAWLVAIEKPAGLLAVPGRGEDKQDCAWARVRAQFADALVVHRLDMATSGVMVFGRGLAAQRQLGIAFAQRAVHKRYVALVHGTLASAQGEIDLPLAADWPARPKQKVDAALGKPSLTRYRQLAVDGESNTTRVELEPLTGRSHQLRVHLLAIGHPIVGDALYGADDEAPRLMLHATQLDLPHPAHGQTLVLRSDAPF
jgi:tRNA pseudouridine32 synthase/23S rRNA pseudouridine746 synthase